MSLPEGVDIIVPIYGAAEDLRRCLHSVALHTDLQRHSLLLVVDGPQDAAVEAVIAAAPATRVLRNAARRGFVASVNLGMQHASRDVLLLNSDTVVTPRWLSKLIEAALSLPKVGTVTPLSNNASLCSVPRPFVENLLPEGFDADAFAALIERVSTRARPQLPTAVGFCMYIRRALLDEIGWFDEAHFGLGYGEENDFCMRASARGWLHLADDATFIEHSGQRSFRAERATLQRAGQRALSRLHPGYLPAIARFMADNPLAATHARITTALRQQAQLKRAANHQQADQRAPRHVLHVLHGWPPFAVAGTEVYAHGLVRQQLGWREVSVYARIDHPGRAQGEMVEWFDQGARVRLLTNHFWQRNPLARNALFSLTIERDFERYLREQQPDIVHVHHLIGHAFSLVRVARRLGIPIVQQLQDWWGLCARVNLLDANDRRCSGPALMKCARCSTLTRLRPEKLTNLGMHALRRWSARHSLAAADAYVMGSQFIRRDYDSAGLLAPGTPVHVLPYGVDVPLQKPVRAPVRLPLRFGFIGSALPHKGLQVARAAFAEIDPALATLQVWGHAGTPFPDSGKDAVFADMDVLVFPSVGLESFGLVAREAMARGVPVIATRDGALLEMDAEFFASGDVAALRAIIQRLVADPTQIDAWSARLAPVKNLQQHAEEIEAVYASVLATRR